MTQTEVQNYVAIVALCVAMCMGLKYVERHVSSLAQTYNSNVQKELKSDSSPQKKDKLRKVGK